MSDEAIARAIVKAPQPFSNMPANMMARTPIDSCGLATPPLAKLAHMVTNQANIERLIDAAVTFPKWRSE